MSSSSYIKILCADNANPKFNRIELRTTPPTYIELQPGENILTVEEYPDLKFGFSQICILDNDEQEKYSDVMSVDPIENCQEVLEIDFSHYDWSDVKYIDSMFSYMCNLRHIEWGSVNKANLTSLSSAFSMMGDKMDELDLSSLNLSKVKDLSYMFSSCSIKKVVLSNCDLRAVKYYNSMFDSCFIEELNFDGCKINNPKDIDFQLETDATLIVSMNGCDEKMVRAFSENIIGYRSRFDAPQKQIFIVSASYSKMP